ncbi:crystallin zeta like 1 [Phyllostomus discolor]|uniref:Crystallin zeta like 1 n=1 Tax=Phyllostomus discolor TaxID=89673 RepID=A0A834EEQ6_9CHIR|nr:crystallin zeta like 1 [Phyllostomus discolor]
MKGLYFQQNSPNEDITFVFQERENLPVTEENYVKLQVKACALSRINTKLLAEMKMEKEFFPVGREIAGIVLDVHKPEKVSWTEAAGTVRDGVRAYTALHYLSPLSAGKAVLIMDGASTLGTIAIQLALHRGAKVISTASSLEDKQHLERLRPPLGRVWRNPSRCMRRKCPWKLFRKIKEEKSKSFDFNVVLSHTSVGLAHSSS